MRRKLPPDFTSGAGLVNGVWRFEISPRGPSGLRRAQNDGGEIVFNLVGLYEYSGRKITSEPAS